MRKKCSTLMICSLLTMVSWAQPDRWQQRVKYTMDVAMNVTTNRFTGKQRLEYTNNSPDTLKKVYYHLYWNAFQPNSMMDMRILGVGSPHKVMYIGGYKTPGKCWACRFGHSNTGVLVTKTNLVRVLQITSTADHIVLINGNVHFIIAQQPVYVIQ